GEEVALDHAVVAAERIECGEPGVDEALPVRAGVRVETAVHAAGDDEPFREGFSEPGRKREPVLLVECVLEFAEEHRRSRGVVSSTALHFNPLWTTWQGVGPTDLRLQLRVHEVEHAV